MALNALQQDMILRCARMARKLTEEYKLLVDVMNPFYDSNGGWKETITQADLDAIPGFNELTKEALDSGLYALTALIKPILTNSYVELATLAAYAGK